MTVVVLVAIPSLASAAREPTEPALPPHPMAAMELQHATLTNRSLSVDCEERSRDDVRCTITYELDVVATGDHAFLQTISTPGAELHVEPGFEVEHQWPLDHIAIPRGERVHLRGTVVRDLVVTEGEERTPYMVMADALFARHLVLSRRSPRMGGSRRRPGVYGSPLAPTGAPMDGPLTVTARLPETVSLIVDHAAVHGTATIESGCAMLLTLDAGPEAEVIVRHGGPFLGLGAQSTAANGERFLARAGYELGLHDWIIASVSAETDFQTRGTTALMIEVATPPVFILLLGAPSFSAGVGATWDVSERGHRAGLRLALGAGLPLVGVEGTFDYYASDDEWVIGLVGRIGI